MSINLPLILVLAGLHLGVGHWRCPKAIASVPWAAIAGGIAIAYVFLDLLPALGEAQATVAWLTKGLYFISLLGLLLRYSLMAQMRPGVRFGAAIAIAALSNLLFSYLLNHTTRPLNCLLLFIALGLHYWVNDYSLHEHFPRQYQRYGRWLLAGTLLAGWGLAQIALGRGGLPTHSQNLSIAAIQAFLAGTILLNVLTQELPDPSRGLLLPFASGALGYSALLLST